MTARLRALPWSAPVLLTLLSGYVSLAGSQCLLFALMVMSPIRDTNLQRWTPSECLSSCLSMCTQLPGAFYPPRKHGLGLRLCHSLLER